MYRIVNIKTGDLVAYVKHEDLEYFLKGNAYYSATYEE